MDQKDAPERRQLIELTASRLGTLLIEARRLLDSKGAEAGREPARKALIGTVFFVSQAYGAELARPLQMLLAGLDDLDAGKVPPIYQKAIVSHSPGNPPSVRVFRALIAVIMQLYIDDEMKPAEAAEAAAKAVNRSRDRGQTKITPAEITRWRYEVQEINDSEDDGVRQYRDTLTAYRKLFPNDPDAAALNLSEALHPFRP